MCTPLLLKMHTPRPFVKRCYGRKRKKLCGNRFRSTAEPYIVKKYRRSLANQGLCKKKLNTNQDTHCIKIGVQLWCGHGDSNPNALLHENLNLACLPIPSCPRSCGNYSTFPARRQEFFTPLDRPATKLGLYLSTGIWYTQNSTLINSTQ